MAIFGLYDAVSAPLKLQAPERRGEFVYSVVWPDVLQPGFNARV